MAVALVGGLFVVSSPAIDAAPAKNCRPVTLDQLFPGLDKNGNIIPTTTTTIPPSPTTTTTPETSSTTVNGETTTTTSPPSTTTTSPTPTTPPPPPAPGSPCRTWTYDMVFPIATGARIISDFGDDRDGGSRRHKGTDLVADRMSPVVAVADGVVSSVHNTPAEDCCYLIIRHNDGWSSMYVHLNNDNYPGDDGLGLGVAPGLTSGSEVTAGQVIGWVGDSGNAEGSIPHLHFELRDPSGYSVDPVPSVRAAQADSDQLMQNGIYGDDEGLPVEQTATHLAAAGGFWPCDETQFDLCPNRLAQPDDTAALIGQLMGISPILVDTVEQTLALEQHIPAGTLAQVTGCEPVETCLQSGITAADVARMISWVYDAQSRLAIEPETDLVEEIPLPSPARAEVNLRFRSIIEVCHPQVDGDHLVTRAEVIDLVTWWILGEHPYPCVQKFDPDI